MLIAARSEEEAVGVALSESIPVDSLDDFDREVVRTVQLKERMKTTLSPRKMSRGRQKHFSVTCLAVKAFRPHL
jgi:hypothetical protein